jgi:hypothetical protein
MKWHTFALKGLSIGDDERYCEECSLLHQTCSDSGPDWECFVTRTGLDYDSNSPRGNGRYFVAYPPYRLWRPADCPLEPETEEPRSSTS